MTNQEIARILFEMAALCEMEGVEFKPRAYEKAAMAIEATAESIETIYQTEGLKGLTRIPGVGKGIAQHIEDLLKSGHFAEYDKFKKKIPVEISELMGVGGLGPRMIKTLWEKLRIHNLEELEKAARAEKIRRLAGFGARSEQKILKGIEFLKKARGRQLLGFVLPEIRKIEKQIGDFSGVERAMVAGSIRRMRETIGDIDIVVASAKPAQVMTQFLKLSEIEHVYGKGPTKINVRLRNGLDADLRIVPEESFGAALCYFTGSKDHNIALREIAVRKKWKLNEYGLFQGKKMLAGRTEEEIYERLGLQYVAPELRECTGEIDCARQRKLPKLIGYSDLKGDLQVQTDWTDGEDSIEKMADAAEQFGLQYIAITDHT
ncbi:MAG TPA: helix-hairpin-helix domain-containing protein, partial [Acidobacteriota bacterium]|nr:helix-hairpin-helix domain-containing protein [Acidobacteriota bacterium]